MASRTSCFFMVTLILASNVQAFFDFHVSEPYEHYELEKRDWESNHLSEFYFMSYPEWLEMDNQRAGVLWDYICDGFSSPDLEPPMQHHNERGSD